ncbi:hypothetical protein DTO166G4_8364 [Paecilomyces variotii]|uniref:Putative methyltransferase n=1 Tax=Byssochlamys spectabilis TaxID=264951 RepID=A0A443HNV4_BYSSP|nr:putative methyltransferase [Paecilomyces variotii]KAJ9210009.1 hypothetical protein DTO166G4_8364 [Paecilomyces variotii]KAJ9229216.1 hypothetical protein DTO166G5_8005 [Paecilomyces variotii]KAJ9348123.1 hypothetical protein DTO280E4_9392 [Paecilomyces variotii]RWQ93503.1 putative methyltransferase [Paecilomyces variotii]
MATATSTTNSTTLAGSASDPNYVPRGPVETELTFFVPPADGSVPFNYVEQPPEGEPERNYGEGLQKVHLTDVRGHESEYNLDKDAFQVLQNVPTATTYETFNSDEEVQKVYYPEVEKLLLDNVPGAHSVILFDHTIRRQDPNAPRQPVNRAHVDQTVKAAEDRVRLHVQDPKKAEELLKGRYRIINVWRPLNGVVQGSPLAFASADSVDPNDLVPIQHRYPHRTGEIMGVKYNPNQKWMYLSGMDNHERLFLKCSDTQEGVAQRVPHTAFTDQRTPVGAKPRESIEVRALVFG